MEISIFGYEVRVEIILICILIIVFIQVNTFCSCAGGIKEGFELIDNLGANLSYIMGQNIKGSVHDLQFTKGENSTLKEDIEKFSPENASSNENVNVNEFTSLESETQINIYKDLETNNKKEESLETIDSEIKRLDVFENTKFSPECCPSNYSSSTGCACMTPEQMKFLGQRGGNRTLNTEY
jgi:hypothetical protein